MGLHQRNPHNTTHPTHNTQRTRIPHTPNARTHTFSHPQVGVIEDQENRPRLSKLLRFYSSKSEEGMTSLEGYVGRMKEGQKGIYYMVRHKATPGGGAGGRGGG